jgi:N-dimethylarginine dimethylaminohydrolase
MDPIVITHPSQLPSLGELPGYPHDRAVLLVDPSGFDIKYVINPHMKGNVGAVDHAAARDQWLRLRDACADAGLEVSVLPGDAAFPDLVFVANQGLPVLRPDGSRRVIASRMHAPQRRGEVPIVSAWHAARGVEVAHIPGFEGLPFEGTGDATFVPGRRILVAGYGFRTDPALLGAAAALAEAPTVALRLVDPRFYHLDTCLQVIDAERALYVPEAFDEDARVMLAALFPRLSEVPLAEAVDLLSCNGWSPDGRTFIVQAGAHATNAAARALGLTVIEVPTGEFLKSGGSVYCLKLGLPW